jgi:porin
MQFSQTVQSVVNGGRDTGTKDGGTLDYNINFDLQRMGIVPGGLLTLRAESRYGEWINDVAGPALPANVDGLVPLTDDLDENICLTITNLYYTQSFSEQFALMIGKFDTMQGDSNEFASGRGVS